VASSLSKAERPTAAALATRAATAPRGTVIVGTLDPPDVAVGVPLGPRVQVLLQRSVDRALAPFRRLHRILIAVMAASLLLTGAGGVFIARSVARPVRSLSEGARRVEKGEYGVPVVVERQDEIGDLANAFNRMTHALAAFQRYVPAALVRTLIAQGKESLAEARVATILFVDLAGFTALAESMSPQRTVDMLNEYFTAVAEPIERYQGVITQFQGDAILAVFNVPIDDPGHARHAVAAAWEIAEIMARRRFAGGIELHNRIGINTGEVVAGSVGSPSRVHYTVHGDAVNLAARLEALNKQYGSRVLISEATARLLADPGACTEIGSVEIRGRREAVTVYRVA